MVLELLIPVMVGFVIVNIPAYLRTLRTLEVYFDLASEHLYVRGDVGPDDNTGRWNSVPGAGSSSEVTPGSTVTLGLGTGPVPDDYTVRVVYQSAGNETSSTLAQSTGPGA